MTFLADFHRKNGATLAPDSIPLHFGDALQEIQQAQQSVILLDRSHEGRILLSGKSRFELLNRMSTNKMVDFAPNQGKPTILTTPTARVIDRLEVYPHPEETLLLLTGTGRSNTIRDYIQRNIFFNDEAVLTEKTASTAQFALHGEQAEAHLTQLFPQGAFATMPLWGCVVVTYQSATFFIVKRKPIIGTHWGIIVPQEGLKLFLELFGGITWAGSLAYNALRIEAGVLSNNELNGDYLPLELGLWDEISFHKGCYTGQEIIARMDSREKLARLFVKVKLSQTVSTPATLYQAGVNVGMLTSNALLPNGENVGIAVIKSAVAAPQTPLTLEGHSAQATVIGIIGTQPDWVVAGQ